MATIGTESCRDSDLDWYKNTIGETPCRTYERLLQSCDSSFKLSLLKTDLKSPSTCGGQSAGCCCNSIAFSLSMFCLTCQNGAGSSRIGYDAPAGTYQKYLNSCSPVYQKSLPSSVQSSVCSAGIQLYDGFYNRVYWGDGSWFYRWSSDFLSGEDKAIKTCPAPPPPTSTSTSTSSPPPVTETQTTTDTPPPPTTTTPESDNGTPQSSPTQTSTTAETEAITPLSRSLSSSSTTGALLAPASSGNSPASTTTAASSHEDQQSQNQDGSSSNSRLSTGALAGIIVGAVVLFALAIFLGFLICRTLKKRHPRAVEQVSRDEWSGAATPVPPAQMGVVVQRPISSGLDSYSDVTSSASRSQPGMSPNAMVIPSRKEREAYGHRPSPSGSTSAYSSTVSHGTGPAPPSEHEDAGPLLHAMDLNRSPSGRLPPGYNGLPPAYGDDR